MVSQEAPPLLERGLPPRSRRLSSFSGGIIPAFEQQSEPPSPPAVFAAPRLSFLFDNEAPRAETGLPPGDALNDALFGAGRGFFFELQRLREAFDDMTEQIASPLTTLPLEMARGPTASSPNPLSKRRRTMGKGPARFFQQLGFFLPDPVRERAPLGPFFARDVALRCERARHFKRPATFAVRKFGIRPLFFFFFLKRPIGGTSPRPPRPSSPAITFFLPP